MHKKYDIIYSLGRDCACALYMKKFKLRTCSGPFDWLTGSDLNTRFILIASDFCEFLLKEDLKPMEKPQCIQSDTSCDYYRNIRTGLLYWHDFSSNILFDEAYKIVKEKYDRRINRFCKNLNSKSKVLLIWFSQGEYTPDELIIKYSSLLNIKFNKKIDLIIIEHKDGQFNLETYRLNDHITRYFCHTTFIPGKPGSETLGNEQLISSIFEKIKLHRPFYLKVTEIFRKFINIFIHKK